MNRRHFLSLMGGGLVSPLWAATPPLQEREGRVIVVGAGFSGLSAALSLAEQGVQVEVIESRGRIGGRYASWMEAGPGGRISVGHTPLTVASTDQELTAFLDEMGVRSAFERHPSEWSWRLEGRLVDSEDFWGPVERGLALWRHARRTGERGIPLRLTRGCRWLRSSSQAEVLTGPSGQSLQAWQASTGLLTPWSAVDEVLAPVLFNGDPTEVDASSFLLAEKRSRWGGSNKPLLRPSENGESILWGVIREQLEERGVQFRLGVEVSEIRLSGGAVTGLTLGEFQPGVWTQEAPLGWSEVPREGRSSVHLRRDPSGLLEAFTSREARPEQALYVVEGADGIHIEGEDQRSHLEADSVVLACGPESTWALAGDLLSEARRPVLRERVSARFWMGSPLLPESPTWIVSDGASPAVGTALSRIESDSRAWADDDGCVVSVEMPQFDSVEEEALMEVAQQAVGQCWPELAEAPVLESRVHRWWVPVTTPGSATRSPVTPTVPGLQLAGEHLSSSEVLGPEAAVISGRAAAERAVIALR